MVRSNESSTPLSREARWRRGDSMDTKSKSGLRATQSLTTEKMVSGTKPTRGRGKNGAAVGLMVRPRLRDGSRNADVGQLGGAGGRGGTRRRGRMSMMRGGEREAGVGRNLVSPTYPTPSSFRHPVSFTPFVTYHSLCHVSLPLSPTYLSHAFLIPSSRIHLSSLCHRPPRLPPSSRIHLSFLVPSPPGPRVPSIAQQRSHRTDRWTPSRHPSLLSWLCAARHLLSGQTLCRAETALGLCVHRVAPSPPRFARQWG